MQELSLNILDIAQNSISAGASLIEIAIIENLAGNSFSVSIKDNGCGMSPEFVEKVTDPFTTTRTTRKVGMGLPLLKLAAEMTGGGLDIESRQGVGTEVTAHFVRDHIDRLPLGDIASTFGTLVFCNPDLDFCLTHSIGDDGYSLSTYELKDTLGEEVKLDNADVMEWIKAYICENELILLEAIT